MIQLVFALYMLPTIAWAANVISTDELEREAFERYALNSEFVFSDDTRVSFPASVKSDISECYGATLSNVGSANRKLSHVKVEVDCDNGRSLTFRAPVLGNVQVYRSMEFSKKEIALELLRLKQTFVSIQDAPNGFYSGSVSGTRLSLKSNIKLDEILLKRDLKRTQDVERNQEITAIAEINGIRIQMDAIALKDGIIGEVIPVKNANSGKRFSAVVSKKGQVKVVK